MAGDLFALELKNLLKDETGDLKHYEMAFSVGNRLDELGFLQGMAAHLGVKEIETEEHYIKIIEKIFSSLITGSIVFVELRKIDLLDNKESFLSWLINVFWKELIEKIDLVCKLKKIEQIRFIILVSSDDDKEEEYSGLSFFCQSKAFKIPLKDWSEKEIRTWLRKFSLLSTDKIDTMTKSIYKSSRGGTPKLICDSLKNKLS